MKLLTSGDSYIQLLYAQMFTAIQAIIFENFQYNLSFYICMCPNLDDWTLDCWMVGNLDDWSVGPFDYNLIQMDDYTTDSCAISLSAFLLAHLVISERVLYNHALSVVHRRPVLSIFFTDIQKK